jgi:hypothetical protein
MLEESAWRSLHDVVGVVLEAARGQAQSVAADGTGK